MTNNAKLAKALRLIGEGIYELADALLDQPPDAVMPEAGTVARPAPVDLPPSFDELPPEWVSEEFGDDTEKLPNVATARRPETPQGALAQCPKHHVLYKTGKYGKYCPSISDDPSWRNDKGFCRITPKNAAAWLAETAA